MSTLGVNTLTDASGSNASTPNQILQGRAKAWFIFNGTGTVADRDNFNISSYTDNGVGDFSVNFVAAMTNLNSPSLTGVNSQSGTSGFTFQNSDGAFNTVAPTTAAHRFFCTTGAFAAVDRDWVRGTVFGD